jgi:AraC-like DNA-binding protein
MKGTGVAHSKTAAQSAGTPQAGQQELKKSFRPGAPDNGRAPAGNDSAGEDMAGLSRRGEEDAVRRIEQSITYMREHLDQPLQVATLAAVANISQSHFFALFKRRTGHAPMDYFTRLRMQQACRLLDGTSASVKEVAATLGYEDAFYFSRVFKLFNRVSPSEYRALQKQSPDASPDAGKNQPATAPLPGNKNRNEKIR